MRAPEGSRAADPLTIERSEAKTADGWRLELKRTWAPGRFEPASRPVVIIPGYGMNSFIFGFHPRGTSMERSLAEAGFEVWSANLRQQGGSRPLAPDAPGPSLRAYAAEDVRAIVDTVLAQTRARADAVDLVGASLGGSIAYAHLAMQPRTRVHGLVSIGAPLRWVEVHPVLRLAFSSPALAGMLAPRGARGLARHGLKVLARYPSLLSLYMNASHVDLSAAATLVETVEDPIPRVNRAIARWIRDRDLVVGGVNVTQALGQIDRPLLVVVSNRDGIVPERVNLSVTGAWGGRDVEVLRVGDERQWYAHADLFIGDQAPAHVFEPIARWLRARR